MEQYQNDTYYFHIAVLLDRAQRWMKIKQCIKDNYDIVVNFSDHPGNYSAHKYVTKEYQAVLASSNHSTSVVEPRTASATKPRAGKDRKMGKHAKRMSNTDAANIVLQRKIHGRLELLALATKLYRWSCVLRCHYLTFVTDLIINDRDTEIPYLQASI